MTIRHTSQVQTARAILGRMHILFHSLAILSLMYYRFLNILTRPNIGLSWVLVTLAELVLTFLWSMTQGFRWRPVLRSVVGPEELKEAELPGLDVFICTADPKKEPVLEVMNSVISAMALDYPPSKLAVYLSDDGGSPFTRRATKEACEFGKVWLPFCRKYRIKTRCPEAFFSSFCDEERREYWNAEFNDDLLVLKSKYEALKSFVETAGEDATVVNDRAPHVEIMHDKKQDDESEVEMPLVVYLAREKRHGMPHRFKAGALNALLRVSSLLSNGPFLLVLDCDMYCNDSTSARQSMCFLLDPKMAPSLAFVQYPQIFYNTSKNDIYDGQARSAHKTKWQGMDGLRGPLLSGTGYFLKRKALYGKPDNGDALLSQQPERTFGSSKKLIASLSENFERSAALKGLTRDELLQEAKNLATCTYESNTLWGDEIGYTYECLLESSITGYLLHCKGWISVYLYPKRPSFLGCTTIDMKDAMVQLMKWTSGWFGVGISKLSPFAHGMPRISVMQTMCYGYFTYSAMYAVPFLIYGIVLPLSLVMGNPIFPKATDPWFGVFVVIFTSSLLQHLHEVLSTNDSIKTWWNELRIWIIKSVSACLFGMVDAVMKKLGVLKTSFRLTNKAVDKEKLDKYEKGEFDFQGADMFMIPLIILVVLNLVSSIGGLVLVIVRNNYEEMFGQLMLSFFLLVLSYPILQEMVAKARKAR